MPELLLHALGRREDAAAHWDPQSLRYPVTRAARRLASVYHRRIMAALDQLTLGKCTIMAAVGACATQPLANSVPLAVVEEFTNDGFTTDLYSEETQNDPFADWYNPATGRVDTGSDGLSAAKTMKRHGWISGYRHATSLETMRSALQDTPVIIGIEWREGFDRPDSDGLVKLEGDVRGGHEVEVLGVDEESHRFRAINSWGPKWGVDGEFEFSFDDMDALLHSGGDCTQLLPLSVPAPTPIPVPSDAVDARLVAGVAPWVEQARAVSWLPTGKAGRARAAIIEWELTRGYRR